MGFIVQPLELGIGWTTICFRLLESGFQAAIDRHEAYGQLVTCLWGLEVERRSIGGREVPSIQDGDVSPWTDGHKTALRACLRLGVQVPLERTRIRN